MRLRELDEGRFAEPREISDRSAGEGERNGYFFYSSADPWPSGDEAEVRRRVPADWLDPAVWHRSGRACARGCRRRSRSRREAASPPTGLSGHFVPAPFRFCLSCGVSYGARQIADFGKLSSLGAGGRSTSTTSSAFRPSASCEPTDELPPIGAEAAELLRQPPGRLAAGRPLQRLRRDRAAALRAVPRRRRRRRARAHARPARAGSLRRAGARPGALRRRARAAGVRRAGRPTRSCARCSPTGSTATSSAAGGSPHRTSSRPGCCGSTTTVSQSAAPTRMSGHGSCPRGSTPTTGATLIRRWRARGREDRERVARVLLDYMRRELAIKVDALDESTSGGLKQRSSQRLTGPWAIDEHETLSYSATLFPRPRAGEDERSAVYLSPRGGFGLYLRRHGTFPLHQRSAVAEGDRADHRRAARRAAHLRSGRGSR